MWVTIMTLTIESLYYSIALLFFQLMRTMARNIGAYLPVVGLSFLVV